MSEATDHVRRKEIEATLPALNEQFQHYTTSTAFSMSLSRSMIRALLGVENAVAKKLEYNRCPISDTALVAIARRGLIEWIEGADTQRRFDGDKPRLWSDLCRVTRPGELMLELLAEAGLVERAVLRGPLPPPPPGWLDPRPRLVLDRNGSHLEPSRREQAQR